MFLVASVLILYDNGSITTFLKPFLGIVTPELALDQHSCLGHLLIVGVLIEKEIKYRDFI